MHLQEDPSGPKIVEAGLLKRTCNRGKKCQSPGRPWRPRLWQGDLAKNVSGPPGDLTFHEC